MSYLSHLTEITAHRQLGAVMLARLWKGVSNYVARRRFERMGYSLALTCSSTREEYAYMVCIPGKVAHGFSFSVRDVMIILSEHVPFGENARVLENYLKLVELQAEYLSQFAESSECSVRLEIMLNQVGNFVQQRLELLEQNGELGIEETSVGGIYLRLRLGDDSWGERIAPLSKLEHRLYSIWQAIDHDQKVMMRDLLVHESKRLRMLRPVFLEGVADAIDCFLEFA